MRFDELVEFSPSGPRAAVVTGGTGALGRALVQHLALAGWHVVFQYHRDEATAAALAQAGGGIVAVRCDLADGGRGVADLFDAVERIGVPLDAFVHCAAGPTTEASGAQNGLQVEAFLRCVERAFPGMKHQQHGAIVGLLTEALLGEPVPGWTAYRAAKMALAAVISELAHETRPCNVRVIGVLPGAIAADRPREPIPSEIWDAIRRRWPLGLRPADVARLIGEIVDEPERFANGVMVAVNPQAGVRLLRGPVFEPWETPVPTRSGSDRPAPTAAAASAPPAPRADALQARLEQVFRSFFDLREQVPVADAEIGTWANWDSLRHLELLMTIEAVLGVDFSDDEGATLTSFGLIMESLRRKGIEE